MTPVDLDRTLQVHLEEDEKLFNLIRLTFSLQWNIIIGTLSYALFIVVLFVSAIDEPGKVSVLYIALCDAIYALDVLAALIYMNSRKMNQFLPYKPRHWLLLFVDIVSLVPLGFGYETYVDSNGEERFWRYLFLNRCLRIYRVFIILTQYDLTIYETYQYIILMFVRFAAHVVLFSHLFTCIWVNVPHFLNCTDSANYCFILYESKILSLLLHNWAGEADIFFENEERIIVLVVLVCGIFLIYADFVPYILIVFMRMSSSKGRYYQKYLQLNRYLKNLAISEELNEKLHRYFRHLWLPGTTGLEMDSAFEDLPISLKKEVFTDIYWDALQHSNLLRGISRCCKRSLSLVMQTEYYQEGEILFEKGKDKLMMVYLVSGLLELMAEENKESPIMSFSSGTILGEMSLFGLFKSHATIRCRTLCQLQILTLREAYPILMHYPKDKNQIFEKLNMRLIMAKATQWRKRQIAIERMIGVEVGGGVMVAVDNEDTVKWLKMQWRAIWEEHERYIIIVRALEEGLRIPAWRKTYELQSRLDAVSYFMDIMVLSDIFEEKKDVVCLKTTFPWAMDPDTQFLILWRRFVIVCALVANALYPFWYGWLHSIPRTAFILSNFFSLIFAIDFSLILMTAVKTKHGIHTRFQSILMTQLKRPTFYMDFLAAIPFQLYNVFGWSEGGATTDNKGNLVFLICLVKAHVFFKPHTNIGESMVAFSFLKNVVIFFLLLYWLATIIQIVLIKRMFGEVITWNVTLPVYNDPFVHENLLSVFIAISTSLSVPYTAIVTDSSIYLAIATSCSIFFFFWTYFFIGDFYAVYSIKISNSLQFRILYDRVLKYIESSRYAAEFYKHVIRVLDFQWAYNKADDLLVHTPVITLAHKCLKRSVYIETLFPALRSCPMFQEESNDFIYDIIDKSFHLAVPAGTVFVSYRVNSFRIYLLHRGYCQLNSYLRSDIKGGVASPILIRPGAIFPTLTSFTSDLTPISVITLTDCEVVVLELENVLKTMIVHGFFRDLVVVIHDGGYIDKLSDHDHATIRVDVRYNPPRDADAEYLEPFRRLGWLGFVLRLILIRRMHLYNLTTQKPHLFFLILLHIHLLHLFCCAILWPFCFGLLIYYAEYIILTLLYAKIFVLIFMYIQFHAPYFDDRGILITHPLYTMGHYLSTAFFFDVFVSFPTYTVYRSGYQLFNSRDDAGIVVFVLIQKSLCLLPINAYIDDLTRDSKYIYLLRPIKLIALFCLILNALVSTEMALTADWVLDEKGNVVGFTGADSAMTTCRPIRDNDVVDFYMTIMYRLIGLFTANNVPCRGTEWQEEVYAHICSVFGLMMVLIFYGWLASHSAVKDAFATVYQERMKAFLKFLLFSKTEDRILEKSIGFFEHQWSRSPSLNLNQIVMALPNYLREEIACPSYKPILSRNAAFFGANEGFYRLLSARLELVHFNRGSVVFFKGQVTTQMYFIHRGKCFVFDWFLTLDVGSIIGDINRTGVVVNKVFALTHVELLRIDSATFYTIIDNFHDVELRFVQFASRSENFIKSVSIVEDQKLRRVDSRDVLNAFNLLSKGLGFEDQSYFEDPENLVSQTRYIKHDPIRLKRLTFTLYPGTWGMALYDLTHLTVDFITVLVMPIWFFYGGLTSLALAVIYTLDVLWIILVFVMFRVGLEDDIKGDVITDGRIIARSFFRAVDGLWLALIAGLPFDVVPILIAHTMESVDATLVAWLRTPRLIRGYYLLRYLRNKLNKFKVSDFVRYISLAIRLMIAVNSIFLVQLSLTSSSVVVDAMTPHEFGVRQFRSILIAYEYVLNVVTSANLPISFHETKSELICFYIFSIVSIFIRGLIVKDVLTTKYISGRARAKYKNEVSLLESYFKAQDLSPSILNEVLEYKLNLLIASRSESMPTLLLSAPAFLQRAILSDLYLQHLINSPVFQGVGLQFLRLLVSRVKRQIYFPGQKIVEKGDVDHSMYFLHTGEVYIIDDTDDLAYIEYVIGRLEPRDRFGEAQGLVSLPHEHTYRARTVVEVVALNAFDWVDVKRVYRTVYDQIMENLRNLKYI